MLPKLKTIIVIILISISFLTNNLFAHCDSVEGPVVNAAKKTLATGNLNYVFLWINHEDENEITEMFNKVMNTRDYAPEVKELVEMYFFETVVRVHRMGEGVGYTGLKYEEFQPAEGIAAADRAIERNSVDLILPHVDKEQREHVSHYFSELQSRSNYNVDDVETGREYVKSYVHFIHYVEGLFGGETEHNNHHESKHQH